MIVTAHVGQDRAEIQLDAFLRTKDLAAQAFVQLEPVGGLVEAAQRCLENAVAGLG